LNCSGEKNREEKQRKVAREDFFDLAKVAFVRRLGVQIEQVVTARNDKVT
jgi:hypothetical protein